MSGESAGNNDWKCRDCKKIFDEKLKKKKFTFNLAMLLINGRPEVCPFCESMDIMPHFGYLMVFTCPKCNHNQSKQFSEAPATMRSAFVECSQCGTNFEGQIDRLN